MLRFRGGSPFDFGLCRDSVTVYHREGLTRALQGVHFEQTVEDSTVDAVTERRRDFLLVVPFPCPIEPGDTVEHGGERHIAKSVKRRTFMGAFSHLEVRG